MLIASDIHFGREAELGLQSFLRSAADPSMTGGLVLLAGDLTQRARSSQYRDARAMLARLLENNVVVVTPGNHDFSRHKGAEGASKKIRDRYRDLLEPVLLQEQVAASCDMDLVVRHQQEVIVVLRSSHRGLFWSNRRITEEQVSWAAGVLRDRFADRRGLRFHLLTHRSLWPGRHSPIIGRKVLEEQLLKPFEFMSVIHGHNHQFTGVRKATPHNGFQVIHLSVPTLSTKSGDKGYVVWNPPSEPQWLDLHGKPARPEP